MVNPETIARLFGLYRQVPVEGDTIFNRSVERGYDDYYVVPRLQRYAMRQLQVFLPDGYEVRPWTINRAISIFRGDELVGVVGYEMLDDQGENPWQLRRFLRYLAGQYVS